MPTTQRFSEIAADALSIKLFGKKLEDLSVNMPSLQLPGQVSPIPAHTFAMVYCVYANGNCIDFTRPHLFLLPDNGTAPDGSCRTCNDATQYLMWVLAADAPLISMDYKIGSAQDIIKSRLDVDSNFAFHDVRLSGTTISGKIRAYLHLYQSGPFGTTLLDWTVLDADWDFSLDISTGTATFNFGPATVTIQYFPPATICGSVNVSVSLPAGLGSFNQTFPLGCVSVV